MKKIFILLALIGLSNFTFADVVGVGPEILILPIAILAIFAGIIFGLLAIAAYLLKKVKKSVKKGKK